MDWLSVMAESSHVHAPNDCQIRRQELIIMLAQLDVYYHSNILCRPRQIGNGTLELADPADAIL